MEVAHSETVKGGLMVAHLGRAGGRLRGSESGSSLRVRTPTLPLDGIAPASLGSPWTSQDEAHALPEVLDLGLGQGLRQEVCWVVLGGNELGSEFATFYFVSEPVES